MKDNLFELLLNLFEKTLTQLKESHVANHKNGIESEQNAANAVNFAIIKAAQPNSMRVVTYDEQIKLTKASYQFLMRAVSWGVISKETFEVVIHQLLGSESRFVTLQETKWTIRNTLAQRLDAEQLAFLDLVLYHQEDQLLLH